MTARTILLAALLSGCATSSTWTKSGASADDFYRDLQICTDIAAKRQARAGVAVYSYYVERDTNQCLINKGWRADDAG